MTQYNTLNPNHQVIYLNKQRPLIFNQQYNLKYKKKTFDDIYNSPIFNQLSFLINNSYQSCQCLNKIYQCPKLKDILKQNNKSQAKNIFQQLKFKAINSSQNHLQNIQSLSIQNQVLQPHFQNLQLVINSSNSMIFSELLKHLKTDYTTFWVYGLYISKFLNYQKLIQNISQISVQLNLQLDIKSLTQQKDQRLKIAYETKLLSIFKGSFPSIVNIICKSSKLDMIIQKLLICNFIKGRQRKQIEIINAAMQM